MSALLKGDRGVPGSDWMQSSVPTASGPLSRSSSPPAGPPSSGARSSTALCSVHFASTGSSTPCDSPSGPMLRPIIATREVLVLPRKLSGWPDETSGCCGSLLSGTCRSDFLSAKQSETPTPAVSCDRRPGDSTSRSSATTLVVFTTAAMQLVNPLLAELGTADRMGKTGVCRPTSLGDGSRIDAVDSDLSMLLALIGEEQTSCPWPCTG
mmetsp:Transcript_103853/g.293713  ORF Transcript_103853/g.293713 Transcript_103853/m.293713 type:complete len:210 (+) Transcript_103853:1199-1828(+)